jgi:hypothetical protein
MAFEEKEDVVNLHNLTANLKQEIHNSKDLIQEMISLHNFLLLPHLPTRYI